MSSLGKIFAFAKYGLINGGTPPTYKLRLLEIGQNVTIIFATINHLHLWTIL